MIRATQLLTFILFTINYTSITWGATASLTIMSDLQGEASTSAVRDVSADGTVVVGHRNTGLDSEAYLWTSDEGILELGDVPGGEGNSWRPRAVSADGSVVVGFTHLGSSPGAFRWTNNEGMVELSNVPGETGNLWTPSDLSADGSVVVGSRSSGLSRNREATLWTNEGGLVGLGDLPGGSFDSEATAISADGSIVVGRSDSAFSYEQAFRWTREEGMVQLADVPGGSYATGISANGEVIVGGRNPTAITGYRQEAFLWTSEDGIVDLGDLPGGNYYSVALDVSADGSVVVGTSASEFGHEAFIWDATHGMRRLWDVLVHDYGLTLNRRALTSSATAISDDGRTIIGTSIFQSWVVTLPVPEPSSLILGMMASVGILVQRRV